MIEYGYGTVGINVREVGQVKSLDKTSSVRSRVEYQKYKNHVSLELLI